MKIHKFEAHDRKKHLIKDQSINIAQGAEDCLKKNKLSLALQEKSPYVYLYAHPRTDDNGNKVMYWQPRLSRPAPQTNSYLFRAKSKTDEIEVCWLLPPRDMWDEYICGKVTSDNLTMWSINRFRYDRKVLENADPDDMPEERGKQILAEVLSEHKQSLQPKPLILEDSSV